MSAGANIYTHHANSSEKSQKLYKDMAEETRAYNRRQKAYIKAKERRNCLPQAERKKSPKIHCPDPQVSNPVLSAA